LSKRKFSNNFFRFFDRKSDLPPIRSSSDFDDWWNSLRNRFNSLGAAQKSFCFVSRRRAFRRTWIFVCHFGWQFNTFSLLQKTTTSSTGLFDDRCSSDVHYLPACLRVFVRNVWNVWRCFNCWCNST
ncbi:unnamed protein product, partial [Oikopleura dioica]